MLNQLVAYLQHIGNCGAVGAPPTDERCICGLRQVFSRQEAYNIKTTAVVRYLQRYILDKDKSETLSQDNLDAACNVAKGM